MPLCVCVCMRLCGCVRGCNGLCLFVLDCQSLCVCTHSQLLVKVSMPPVWLSVRMCLSYFMCLYEIACGHIRLHVFVLVFVCVVFVCICF